MYEDDKLVSDNVCKQICEEFKKQAHINENDGVFTDKEKIKLLISKLQENEQYLIYLRAYVQKNIKNKSTVQSIGLGKSLQIVQKHIADLLGLNILSKEEIPTLKMSKSSNVKAAIYNCCLNTNNILNTLLWFLLFKKVFTSSEVVTQMAYEQTDVLDCLYKLF